MKFPDQKTVAISTIAFLTAFSLAFIGASELQSTDSEPDLYSEEFDFEVNSSASIKTLEIDGKNLTVLHQDTDEAKFFFDVTGDKQPDRELELVRDGEIHRDNVFATLEGQTYTITIEYSDSLNESGEAFLRITRAEELR